ADVSNAAISYAASKITIHNLVVSPTGTTGGFSIDATVAISNSPGSATVAKLSLSSLTILNQTGVDGNSTLTITTGDTGFTSPVQNPVNLKSTISATADGGNSSNATVVFNSYLDTTNTQFGTQQGAPTITLNGIAPGESQSLNTFASVNAATTPYSLTQIG